MCVGISSQSQKIATSSGLSICSFNCRSFKCNAAVVSDLCNSYDIVLLQEHWLLPHELPVLNTFNSSVVSHAISAVDIGSNVLIGRPYGGTAILYNKRIANSVVHIANNNHRVLSVILETEVGRILLVCVYMPTNYGDEESLASYLNCLSDLQALMIEQDVVNVIIAGDFNSGIGLRFFDEFTSFVNENKMITTDICRLGDEVTYISDDGTKSSWIDHIISSPQIDTMITDVAVLHDVIVSDHKPLAFQLLCNVKQDCVTPADNNSSVRLVPQWVHCDDVHLKRYRDTLDHLLLDINPYCLLHYPVDVDDVAFHSSIDYFYDSLITCIKQAVSSCIPHNVTVNSSHNIPGWNDYVREKHDVARQAFLAWRQCGSQRQGAEYLLMQKSRAQFKLALRYCRDHLEQMKADAVANSVLDKNARKFWQCVHKMSNSKATSLVNNVNNVTGEQNVALMWQDHFQNLYCSKEDNAFRSGFDTKAENTVQADKSEQCNVISVSEVLSALHKQKLGKAVGPDDVSMEAVVYGGQRLAVYLTMLFNCCFVTCYLPAKFSSSVIVPLVKCKTGQLSDVNNYRAIAITNSCSKILESVIYEYICSFDSASNDLYQFGFKEHHSTDMCTFVLKNTIQHYTSHGSYVFACFVDFNKAFDSVNYWRLFSKMLDLFSDSKVHGFVRLLACWYSTQSAYVRWQSAVSGSFNIEKGVRQGGILSPYLFRLYVRDLINSITSMRVGCNITGMMVNILCYADDMVLLAPSWLALQTLITVLHVNALDIGMIFNVMTTSGERSGQPLHVVI